MSFLGRQTSNNAHYKSAKLIILNWGKILGVSSSLQRVEILEIAMHSLSSFLNVYENIGPTMDSFINMKRHRKEVMMGSDIWVEVNKRVTKEDAKSILNFKEGMKRNMLKVKYFKNPDIACHFYDRFIATYGKMRFKFILQNYFMQNLFWVWNPIIMTFHINITSLGKVDYIIVRVHYMILNYLPLNHLWYANLLIW